VDRFEGARNHRSKEEKETSAISKRHTGKSLWNKRGIGWEKKRGEMGSWKWDQWGPGNLLGPISVKEQVT